MKIRCAHGCRAATTAGSACLTTSWVGGRMASTQSSTPTTETPAASTPPAPVLSASTKLRSGFPLHTEGIHWFPQRVPPSVLMDPVGAPVSSPFVVRDWEGWVLVWIPWAPCWTGFCSQLIAGWMIGWTHWADMASPK
jgi:hypothetical protein